LTGLSSLCAVPVRNKTGATTKAKKRRLGELKAIFLSDTVNREASIAMLTERYPDVAADIDIRFAGGFEGTRSVQCGTLRTKAHHGDVAGRGIDPAGRT
jgi:hypothetical protein